MIRNSAIDKKSKDDSIQRGDKRSIINQKWTIIQNSKKIITLFDRYKPRFYGGNKFFNSKTPFLMSAVKKTDKHLWGA